MKSYLLRLQCMFFCLCCSSILIHRCSDVSLDHSCRRHLPVQCHYLDQSRRHSARFCLEWEENRSCHIHHQHHQLKKQTMTIYYSLSTLMCSENDFKNNIELQQVQCFLFYEGVCENTVYKNLVLRYKLHCLILSPARLISIFFQQLLDFYSFSTYG